MNIKDEIRYDFDLRGPKVTTTDRVCIIENTKKVILITDEHITCETIGFYVTVRGEKLSIGEIWEGRIELSGKIFTVEILPSSSSC